MTDSTMKKLPPTTLLSCNRCHDVLPLSEFKWRSPETGYTKFCSECREYCRDKQEKYRAANPELVSQASMAASRRWEAENAEVHARRQQEYIERIPQDTLRKRRKGYRERFKTNNPEAYERDRVRRNAHKREKRAKDKAKKNG